MGIIRDGFVVLRNWATAINKLPEENQLECYKALAEYGLTGQRPENMSPVVDAMIESFSVGMENAIERYNASVENGKKGGAPLGNQNARKKVDETTQNNLEQPKTTTIDFENNKNNLNQPKTTKNNPNVNVNVNVNDNINIIEEESVKEEVGASPPSRTQKHRYGKFKNVLLTDEEYHNLIAEPDGAEAIEFYSEYREMKGYKAKNDNLAIRKWAFKAVKEQRQREKSPPVREESMLEAAAKRLLGG